ncbi:8-amino-7-oxononanoate synthase [hydrothermal vent metagenome]|uniref:8-amino-7-oxononanoate synthase n=1 Tax=hydrothermal vent metagenome TaxID=652676 RepID=A0A3B0X990_9ZZZZ
MKALNNKLKKALNERKKQHRYRTRRITKSPQQIEMKIDNHEVISFCSNDYLGLANNAQIKQATIDAIHDFGVGSGAAHLVNGHSIVHHQLEEELAEFTGYPRAILFSTGYMANLGLCQALVEKGDYVFEDRLNHASLIDGGRISGARLQRYLHNDVANLKQKFKKTDSASEKLVLTDGVFSMDGDVAELPALSKLCKKNKSWLMVDDAHGFGTLGETGKGCLQHFSLDGNDVPIYMATLGKAMGTAGAFIAGSEELIETIIQKSRTYIYTTAMPAAIAEATRYSLHIIQNESRHLNNLNNNISYFRNCCLESSLPIEDSFTAIQPIIIGDDYETLQISQALFERGFLVTAIRPPTVPEGTSRLRITLSAKHTHEHIDQLINELVTLID